MIKGCSLIINCKKIPDDRLFDDNYFFFYEEIDLCKRIKDLNENIYVFNKIKIKHGNAEALDGNSKLKYDDFLVDPNTQLKTITNFLNLEETNLDIFNEPVVIFEVQTGSILKETDIVRYKDIYGRVN